MATGGPLNCSLRQSIYQKIYNGEDADVLRLIRDAFMPELERLKHASIASESEAYAASDCDDDHEKVPSPSHLLFGKEHDEINRTLTSVLALKWILTGKYGIFTRYQNPSDKLRPTSFEKLQELFVKGLAHPGDLFALLVATVVNDLGKDPNLVQNVLERTGKVLQGSNHDTIVYEAAKADMIPCMQQLDPVHREEIMLGLKVGSQLNVAQLAQAENVPGSLEGVLAMRGHEHAFTLKFMEQLLDVAGAAGHVDWRCAKQMIEPVFQGYVATHEVLIDIVNGRSSLRAGYDKVLIKRGSMLQDKGFRPLSISIPQERALLRLLVMGRTAESEQAEWFVDAFENLPDSIRQDLVNGLSVDGHNDGKAILPYYMPAMISECLRSTVNGTASAKTDALSSLMRFLARVFGGTKPMPGQPGLIVERDLMFARDTIRSQAFKTDPSVLDKMDIPTGD